MTQSGGLTHADAIGHVRMVDVGAKSVTARQAEAQARVACSAEALAQLRDGRLAKGDGLAVARVAGIMAAKRTADVIPLCHPLALDQVEVDLRLTDAVDITARVSVHGRTGAEMEALTAAAVAGLTVIDMVKAVDRTAQLSHVRLVAKSGGASGSRLNGRTSGLPAAGVVTVSDRGYAGTAPDLSGPAAVAALTRAGSQVQARLVPDDVQAIRNAVEELVAAGCALIITTGGTGLGPRDVTPEALRGLIDRPVPGLAEAIRAAGAEQTATAVLSRAIAGVIDGDTQRSLVVALPGSPEAVGTAMAYLGPLLDHIVAQLAGGDHPHPVRTDPPVDLGATPATDARLVGVTISDDRLDAAAIEAAVHRHGAGAVVGFTGLVRDNDDGRSVSALEYEAHPTADAVLEAVTTSWLTNHPAVTAVAVSHRIGLVPVGQTALVVAVSAPHRREAFAACADLVDRIKAEVPLWKRQRFVDGTSEWVVL